MQTQKKAKVIKMRKLGKAIGTFIKRLFNVIDKLIITPISKVVYGIYDKFRGNASLIEKVLNRPKALIYLSLIFALAVFFLVDSKVITLVETEAEILVNQEVKVEYNKEAYVIEGLPEAVDITLIGRKSDLYLAKQLGEHEVVLDLTDYEPREEPYKVKLTYKQSIDNLKYKLDPATVSVVVKKKVSTLKSITHDLMNQDKLDQTLSVGTVDLGQSEVVVKGSQDTLDRISSVKALVDLSNPDFKGKGTYPVDSVPLVAYDEAGDPIPNVEIVPATISAEVKLDTYSAKVPIKVLTTGELVAGRAISSILINGKSEYLVDVYGEQSIVDSITSVPVTIDVSGLGSSGKKIYQMTISKPTGVRYVSESSATIEVSFGEESQKTIDNVTVTQIVGLASGLVANAKTSADSSVSVQVKGVESAIRDLTAKDLIASIDLTGRGIGTYDNIPVYVEANDPKVQVIVSNKISIEIAEERS